LSILDEQSNFPQATDNSLVAKFNETFKKKKGVYIASKGSASGTFAIQHYAGKVIIITQ
jgi:myosin heavy subunit